MNVIVVEPPPFEPVSVAEAYDHLRWDAELEGSPPEPFYPLRALIERNIVSAREYVETETGRALVQQTLRVVLPGFPSLRTGFGAGWYEDDCYARPGRLELLRPPLIGLVGVEYLDENEQIQTLDPSHYYVDELTSVVPSLCFRDTFDLSIATAARSDAVRVTWMAGFRPEGSPPTSQEEFAANVPKSFKDAILLGVQLLSDRFDPSERADLERARDALIAGKVVHTL